MIHPIFAHVIFKYNSCILFRIGVPFTQSQFDWSLSEALFYNGLMFAVFAGISLVVYIIYAIYGQKCVFSTLLSFFI